MPPSGTVSEQNVDTPDAVLLLKTVKGREMQDVRKKKFEIFSK